MTSSDTAATRRASRSTRPASSRCCFDMGTGLRYFGKRVPIDDPFRGSCLLSHLHWDHVQGLPFFTPLLTEGSSLDVYGPAQADGRSLDEVVSYTIRPPLFPVSVDELPGSALPRHRRRRLRDRCVQRDGRLIPHLGPTLGFRSSGRSLHRLSLRSPTTVRRKLLGGRRRSRAGRRRRSVDPRFAVHAARVRGQVDLGALHHRLRGVVGLPGRGQAAGPVPPRPVPPRRRPRRLVQCAVAGRAHATASR